MVPKVGQFAGQGLEWNSDQNGMQDSGLGQKAQRQVPDSEWVLGLDALGLAGEITPKDALQDFPL